MLHSSRTPNAGLRRSDRYRPAEKFRGFEITSGGGQSLESKTPRHSGIDLSSIPRLVLAEKWRAAQKSSGWHWQRANTGFPLPGSAGYGKRAAASKAKSRLSVAPVRRDYRPGQHLIWLGS
ncbi:hypothetical protein K0M31_010841 [Melipona bicolor]|uniref:Uncharacterized protein n=1 Tax=Melipona bicolor TaxID=60889 RepID=A0AA40FL70_9HYME|nr:hypothetical protein K0M31_010841 [Melipona bicolor]